jgi:hypothetical protein
VQNLSALFCLPQNTAQPDPHGAIQFGRSVYLVITAFFSVDVNDLYAARIHPQTRVGFPPQVEGRYRAVGPGVTRPWS